MSHAQDGNEIITDGDHRKTESSLSSLSYLSFLRDEEPPKPVDLHTAADWLDKDVQRFILEQRLVTLVQNHMDDTKSGKDTSFSTHALTMAHGDFVYWKGLWNVVDQNTNEDFHTSLTALAQVVRIIPPGHSGVTNDL